MAQMDAPRNWSVSKTGRFGLSPSFRRMLHERPLSGNGPNFANSTFCASLWFDADVASVSPSLFLALAAPCVEVRLSNLGSAHNGKVKFI